MVDISRGSPQTQTVTVGKSGLALLNALASLIGALLRVLQPFTILAFWQVCLGLFVYFFPVAGEQWVAYTHIPWPLLGVVCALFRMAVGELRK